jgi:hypothetical protein
MFAQDSRYVNLAQYVVALPDGRIITATRVAVPPQSGLVLAGFHPTVAGDRLDLLAARYLNDPTLFWKLCDANNASAPAALAARPVIGIPLGGQ